MIKKIFARIRRDVNIKKLVKRGMKVGENCSFADNLEIDYSHCWLIEIGNYVTLTSKCIILAHDASMKRDLGKTKIGRVVIGDNVFVGVGSVVLPNTRIGSNTIIGAGSVVSGEIKPNSVYAGVPAKFLCTKEEFLSKHKELMKKFPVFDEKWTTRGGISDEQKSEMNELLKRGVGYVD